MTVTWQRRIKFVDEIKAANQLTLKWKDYLGLFMWVQWNHKCL